MEMEVRTCIKDNCQVKFSVNKGSKQEHCSQYCRLCNSSGSLIVRESTSKRLTPEAKKSKIEYYQNYKALMGLDE